MKAIDSTAERMIRSFQTISEFRGVEEMLLNYAEAAREECELMKSDPDFFSSWPKFVALAETIAQISSDFSNYKEPRTRSLLLRGRTLLIDGKNLLSYMAGVRVPMPKSIADYTDALDDFDIACNQIGLTSSNN